MDYVKRILEILNHPLQKDMKEGYTKGWQYYKGRKINDCIELGFRCPKGKNIEDVEKVQQAIEASCGADIELLDYKGVVVVRICPVPMPMKIPFEHRMLKGLRPSEILIGYDRIMQRVTFNWEQPHGIIAAETGMGKTDFLRLLVYCLLNDPNTVDIRIIDLKMLSFLPFLGIPNIKIGGGWEEAYDMLTDAAQEVRNRNEMVYKSGTRETTKKLQKIVVIIDEAAEISPKAATNKDDKKLALEMEKAMSTIARLGREVKVHLIYCTQYPTAEIVSTQIKINCGMRLCFYVPNNEQSKVILMRTGAEELHAIPGRAIFKNNLYHTVQVPYVGGDPVWKKMLDKFRSVENDNERRSSDSTATRSDSNDKANLHVIPGVHTTSQQGQSNTQGVSKRKNGAVGMVSKRKTVETDTESQKTSEWISDDL